jgi:5-methylcytosine-specific restriction endonuclease McrA
MSVSQGKAYRAALRNDPCSYCGNRGGHIDHITPRIRRGGDSWTNLTAVCQVCNNGKRDKSLLSFLAWRGPGGWREELAAAQAKAALWKGVGA